MKIRSARLRRALSPVISALALAGVLAPRPLRADNVGVVRDVGLAPSMFAGFTAYDRDLAVTPTAFTIDLRDHFTIAGVNPDQLAQFKTNLGTFNIELLVADAPLTVANFKSYLATNATSSANLPKTYDNTFIHRAIPDFVIQGGGFRSVGGLPALASKAPVANEFNVANTRGTLAMAKVPPASGSDPTPESINSATNQWFINLADNRETLDNQNGGFTVFARMLGSGMTLADTIGELDIYNLKNIYSSLDGALTDVPLYNVLASQTDLLLSNLVTIQTARLVPLQPPATGAGASVLNYTVSTTNPALAKVTLQNGRLRVAPSALPGSAVITVRAYEGGGAYVDGSFTLRRSGVPSIVTQPPQTATKPFGSVATLSAVVSVWPAGTLQWQRKPVDGDWAAIPADDPLFTGEDSTDLKIALDSSVNAAAAYALRNSQFRLVVNNGLGTATSRVSTLKITTLPVGFSSALPALFSGKIGGSASLTASPLSVVANTPLTYQWQRKNPATGLFEAIAADTGPGTARYSGFATATLSVSLAAADTATENQALDLDGTQYRCVLSNLVGSATSVVSTLRVIAEDITRVTSEDRALPGLLAQQEGRLFSATGLPKGLVLDPATGHVSGAATVKAGLYKVTLTVRDGGVVTATRVYYFNIRDLSGANMGGYEAFLATDDTPPCAKLALLIAPAGTFTGTLATTDDKAALALKGSVVRSPVTGDLSLSAPLSIARVGAFAGQSYTLDFAITSAGVLTAQLKTKASADATPVAKADATVARPGVRLAAYSAGNVAPWSQIYRDSISASPYTLAFTDPVTLDGNPSATPLPQGSGYATSTINTSGTLNLKGKLPDGATLTASLATDLAADYRLLARPYGNVPGAWFGANLALTGVTAVRPGTTGTVYTRYSIATADRGEAYWNKPAIATAATYRAGFGPLGLTARMEPWNPNNYTQLGVSAGTTTTAGKTTLVLSGDALSNASPNTAGLPVDLVVTYATALFTKAATPDANAFKGTFAPGTGRLSGQLVLPAPAPKRTVTFDGVFLMGAESPAAGAITAEGFTLVPSTTGSTPSSGRLQIKQP